MIAGRACKRVGAHGDLAEMLRYPVILARLRCLGCLAGAQDFTICRMQETPLQWKVGEALS